MKGIKECIDYMIENEGKMISTIMGCRVVCWYSEGNFFQTTSFDFSDSEVLDDFNTFDTCTWETFDTKIKKKFKFSIDLGCHSDKYEEVELEFPWDSSEMDIKEIVERKLIKWVLDEVSYFSQEIK